MRGTLLAAIAGHTALGSLFPGKVVEHDALLKRQLGNITESQYSSAKKLAQQVVFKILKDRWVDD